jgi:hypothetical protein
VNGHDLAALLADAAAHAEQDAPPSTRCTRSPARAAAASSAAATPQRSRSSSSSCCSSSHPPRPRRGPRPRPGSRHALLPPPRSPDHDPRRCPRPRRVTEPAQASGAAAGRTGTPGRRVVLAGDPAARRRRAGPRPAHQGVPRPGVLHPVRGRWNGPCTAAPAASATGSSSTSSCTTADVRRGENRRVQGRGSWGSNTEVPKTPPGNPLQRVLRGAARAVGAAPPGDTDYVKRVIGCPVTGSRAAPPTARSPSSPRTRSGRGPRRAVRVRERQRAVLRRRDWRAGMPARCAGGRRPGRQASGSWATTAASPPTAAPTATTRRRHDPGHKVVGRAFVIVWPPSRTGADRPGDLPRRQPAHTRPPSSSESRHAANASRPPCGRVLALSAQELSPPHHSGGDPRAFGSSLP